MPRKLCLFALMIGLGLGAFSLTGHALTGPVTASMTISRILEYPALCKITYSASNTQATYPYVFYYQLQKSSTPPQSIVYSKGVRSELFTASGNSESGVIARLYLTFGNTNSNRAYMGWVLVDPNTGATLAQGSTPNQCK